MKKKAPLRTVNDFVLGKTLQNLLEQNHLRQASLAKELSINKATLHNWVNGCVPKSLLTVSRLADFFGLSLDELCIERHERDYSRDSWTFKISEESEELEKLKTKFNNLR